MSPNKPPVAPPAIVPDDPATVPDDPAEYQRFLDMARQVEADETPGALDRAFNKVIRPPSAGDQPTPKRRPA